MPFTSKGLFYRQMPGYPKIKLSTTTATAQEQYMMKWNNLEDFMDESIPPPLMMGDQIIHINRRRFPKDLSLVTEDVSVEPWDSETTGEDPNVPSGKWMRVNINYKVPEIPDHEEEDEDDPETFLTKRMSIGAEFLTLPPKGVKIGSNSGSSTATIANKAADLPITKLIPTAEITLSWKFVIQPPFKTILNMVGTINSGNFLDCPEETLMFLGVDATQELTTQGAKPWTIDYRFSARLVKQGGGTVGWNHTYSPDKQQWVVLGMKGKKLYDTANFKKLFRV